MYIICTYLTSYLSHLAQGTDLTEIARLGPKVSEEWAATHPLHSNCSTILTIIGRYIGVISLDMLSCVFRSWFFGIKSKGFFSQVEEVPRMKRKISFMFFGKCSMFRIHRCLCGVQGGVVFFSSLFLVFEKQSFKDFKVHIIYQKIRGHFPRCTGKKLDSSNPNWFTLSRTQIKTRTILAK